MNRQQIQMKTAFDRQNTEIRKMGEVANTMRLFVMALITKLSPDEKKVLLSATELNALGEKMKTTSLTVDNKALTDEVWLTLVESAEEVTMSVNLEQGDLEVVEPDAPKVEEPKVIELPTKCRCGHMSNRHVAGVGTCKECLECTEFKEKLFLV